MLRKSITTLLLVWIFAASANAQLPTIPLGETESKTALEQFDFVNIQDRWVVDSIEFDGELSTAQVGQRVGDVISVSTDPSGGILIT